MPISITDTLENSREKVKSTHITSTKIKNDEHIHGMLFKYTPR